MKINFWLPIFALTASAFFFAICNSLVKNIDSHIPVSMISLVQCLICFCFTLPWVYQQGISAFRTNYISLFIICALAEVVSIYPFYWSLHYIPLVDGILLNSTGPMWVPLFILFIYKIRIAKPVWMGFISGMIGVSLIIKPDLEIFQLASLLALLSGIGTGVVTFIIGILSKNVPSKQILCLCFLLSLLMLMPIVFFQWQMPTFIDLAWIILSGICLLLGILFLNYGFKLGEMVILSPLLYLSVVFAGIIDWYFWHVSQSLLSFLGTFLVIVGNCIILLRTTQSKKTHVQQDSVNFLISTEI